MLKAARLPAGKTLATLNQDLLPVKVRRQMPTLLEGGFVDRGENLLAAKQGLGLERKMRRLDGFDALIIDDIGYVQQTLDETEVLFTLLAER